MSSNSCWNGWNNGNDDSWWLWGFFIFFFIFFILLLCIPAFYYNRRSDYCGPVLPPERYGYRPSRTYIEVDEVDF